MTIDISISLHFASQYCPQTLSEIQIYLDIMSIKPETIPVDTDYPLSPTRAFYIQHNKATTSVFSLTDSLPLVYSHANGSDVEKGHALATETPSPPIVYTMKRENFFGTHLVARDEDGKDIAEWKSPFISLYAGTTKIKFLENVDGEETKGTEIKVKPASFLKRAEVCMLRSLLFSFFFFFQGLR